MGDEGSTLDDLAEEQDIDFLRTAREEARSVLNHQIQTLNDIDNKAASTLRINMIFLGLLITAGGIVLRQTTIQDMNFIIKIFLVISASFTVISLILSIIFAIWTYTSSKFRAGPNDNDIQRLINEGYNEKTGTLLLLLSYGSWMEQNREVNNRDAKTLFRSHIFLAVGVVLSVVSVFLWVYSLIL